MNLMHINTRSYVSFLDHSRPCIDEENITLLKESVQETLLHKARICTHTSESDDLQQMIIVHGKDTVVRPHRHEQPETFLVLEGIVDVVYFSECGAIIASDRLAGYGQSKYPFYSYIEPGLYHAMCFQSDDVVFMETTVGPYTESSSQYLPRFSDYLDSDYMDVLHDYLDPLKTKLEK